MEELDIRQLAKIILDKKIFILIMVLLSMGLGIAYTKFLLKPIYQSSTTLVLSKAANQDNTTEQSITQNDILLNQKLVETYSEIIKSKKVLKQVMENLGISIMEEKEEKNLIKNISVASVKNTEIIKVSVKNEDPSMAEKIANEIANVFANEVSEIYKIQNVYTIDKAEIETIPYNINHLRDIALFTFSGLIGSMMLVLLLYYFDNRVRSVDEIETYLNLNTLSVIPLDKSTR